MNNRVWITRSSNDNYEISRMERMDLGWQVQIGWSWGCSRHAISLSTIVRSGRNSFTLGEIWKFHALGSRKGSLVDRRNIDESRLWQALVSFSADCICVDSDHATAIFQTTIPPFFLSFEPIPLLFGNRQPISSPWWRRSVSASRETFSTSLPQIFSATFQHRTVYFTFLLPNIIRNILEKIFIRNALLLEIQ